MVLAAKRMGKRARPSSAKPCGEPMPNWIREQMALPGIPDSFKEKVNVAQHALGFTWTSVAMMTVWAVRCALRFRATCTTRVRCMDAVELCSGHGQLSYWLRAAGMAVQEYDKIHRHPDEDLSTVTGICWAVWLVLTVKMGGFVHMAPPCSDWGFLNSFTSGRWLSVHGDPARAQVQCNNRIAEAIAAIIVLCAVRGLFFIIEQPGDSQFFKYPAIKSALENVHARLYTTYQMHFGTELPKETVLASNMPADLMGTIVRGKPKCGKMAIDNKFYAKSAGWTRGKPSLKAAGNQSMHVRRWGTHRRHGPAHR